MIKTLSVVVALLLLSVQGFSQDPGDPPDGPAPAVPIEDYMHLIIIAAAGILGLVVIKRMNRKQSIN